METDILGNSIVSVCIQQSLKCQHSLLKKKTRKKNTLDFIQLQIRVGAEESKIKDE